MSKETDFQTTYKSSFTQDGLPELAKTCTGCLKFLAPTKYKGCKGERDGKSGTIRNSKCRDCEMSKKTAKGMDERITSLEKELSKTSEVIRYQNDKITEFQYIVIGFSKELDTFRKK